MKMLMFSVVAIGGLFAGQTIATVMQADDVVQVAFASYPDYGGLEAFKGDADVVVRGTVVGDGVEYRDFGRVGRGDDDRHSRGVKMRLVTLKPADSSSDVVMADGLVQIAATDVGLNGVSNDATLRDGDEVILMLEYVDVSESEFKGIDTTELYVVVGGRQGVFRAEAGDRWVQDEDPHVRLEDVDQHETDARTAQNLIEASPAELIAVRG